MVAPRFGMLARATPSDSLQLVRSFRRLGEVVALTGDGTNDGPARAEAVVGLAVGNPGTEAAKEASDIVVLDGNFATIMKSVAWCRTIIETIRNSFQSSTR